MRKRHKTRYPGIYYRETGGERRYIVWFSDEAGEHTQTLPIGATLEDAILLKGKLQQRRADGEAILRTRKTVGELLDEWLETRRGFLTESTVLNYEGGIRRLKKTFGSRRITELTPSEIAALIMRMQKAGLKAATIKKTLTPLRCAYTVAVRDGLVASSPVVKLLAHERPKADAGKRRCLSQGEISSLLRATRSRDGNESLQWKALFSLLIFTGLRISEALALTWEDITPEGVVVRKGKTAAAERMVILIPAVRSLLTRLRLSQAPGVEFVFATQQGSPLGRRNALRALHATCKHAGIEKYTLHELRHTFASILIAQRELPTLVAKQMGHADPGVTMSVYAHLWNEQESVDDARDRLQEAMGGIV